MKQTLRDKRAIEIANRIYSLKDELKEYLNKVIMKKHKIKTQDI